jgi:hypothetical protein
MLRTELRNCLDRRERRQIEAELADAMERQSANEAASTRLSQRNARWLNPTRLRFRLNGIAINFMPDRIDWPAAKVSAPTVTHPSSTGAIRSKEPVPCSERPLRPPF